MIYSNFNYFLSSLRLELKTNPGLKIKVVILLYRLSSFGFYKGGIIKLLVFPLYVVYRVYSEFLVGMELPVSVIVGEGLKIYHGNGLVIHPDCKIGKFCTLRQHVTLGNKMSKNGLISSSPVIGDYVEFGAGAVVIGGVEIGSGVVIGANTVVTKNIPVNSIVVGQSSRII